MAKEIRTTEQERYNTYDMEQEQLHKEVMRKIMKRVWNQDPDIQYVTQDNRYEGEKKNV